MARLCFYIVKLPSYSAYFCSPPVTCMKVFISVLLFVLIVIGACKPSAVTAQKSSMTDPDSTQANDNPLTYKQVAEERLGKECTCLPNSDHTMILCKKIEDTNAAAMANAVRFLVIHSKTKVIMYEERLVNAEVEWFNVTQLKITTIPGIVQSLPSRQENYYLYDLVNKQKLAPSNSKF